jgi:putative transposase
MSDMPRYARQTLADIPYHIINRGNNHQVIFFRKPDYKFFLESIELAKEKYPCKIYSFILMPNHIHLLLNPVGEGSNLAFFMKHISQRHGQYINRYYSRTGTLWEGRYKSSAVSTDRYLLACSRYIETNCMRAGIVKKPEEYDFSSYRTKIGLEKLEWLDCDPVYLDLGKTEEERHKKYQGWIHESIPKGELDMMRKSIQRNWAYGGEEFKEKIESMLGRKFEIKKAGRRSTKI